MTLLQWIFVIGLVTTLAAAFCVWRINAQFAEISGFVEQDAEGTTVNERTLLALEQIRSNREELRKILILYPQMAAAIESIDPSIRIDTSTNIEAAKKHHDEDLMREVDHSIGSAPQASGHGQGGLYAHAG